MTKAEQHTGSGIGKDLAVYICLLALAGLQFLIAYQNIDTSQMSLVGEADLSVVCRNLHYFYLARDAIWMDRQLPNAGRCGAIFKMKYAFGMLSRGRPRGKQC
jgi:hypothetical protein